MDHFDFARDKEPATVRCPTRIRALVADDSPGFRMVIGALLKIEDWIEVVARVNDGQEAIEAVTVLLPDLVLIDVGLAKLDGITTASILTHRFPSLDVVLISDKHSSRLRATCQASGAKYFIHKPKFNEEFPQLLTQFKTSFRLTSPNDAQIGSHCLSAGDDTLPERGQRKRCSLLTLSVLKSEVTCAGRSPGSLPPFVSRRPFWQ